MRNHQQSKEINFGMAVECSPYALAIYCKLTVS
jgi:hypothetical protein